MKILVEECDLHTVLRLPNGTFAPYTGAKTNVLFLRKGLPTEKLWIYDARSGVATVTKKDRKLSPKHFEEFVACYGDDPNGKSKRSDKQSKEDRWRSFSIAEVKAKGFKLDELKWLKSDDVDDVDIGDPQEVAERIEAELGRALAEIRALMAELEKEQAPVREAAE
jgi:type I restriction enzyme M protein